MSYAAVERLIRARTLAEVFAAQASGPVTLLAGGTDLMVLIKDGKAPRGTWVDLTALAPLKTIEETGGALSLGALASYSQVLGHAHIRERFAALAEAARQVGSPQIRNAGTFGGNCANASPAGDGLPPLYALDARLTLASAAGTRELPIEEFILGVRKTALAQGELITHFTLPDLGRRSVFLKLGTRAAMAIAKVSVAAAARLGDAGAERTLHDVRIALGAVAPTVLRARAAEALLEGQVASPERIAAAAEQAAVACAPISDFRSDAAYRREMVKVLVTRALRRVVG